MLADEIEAVAKAIYETHWRRPSGWDEASEDVRDWVSAQALSAINAMRAMGWRRPHVKELPGVVEPPGASATAAQHLDLMPINSDG